MTRANARELVVHLIYGREFTGEEPDRKGKAIYESSYSESYPCKCNY